jgi:hypothetical protein
MNWHYLSFAIFECSHDRFRFTKVASEPTLLSAWASNYRSTLALLPLEKLFADRNDILVSDKKFSSAYAHASRGPFDNVLTDPW